MSPKSPVDAPSVTPEPGFAAAMRELEAILARIEREEVDVDLLALELERAAALVEICRGKIRRAEVEVTQILQRLEEPPAPPADPPSS